MHLSIVEADGEMQMRFALWAIIMQIGKNAFFIMLLLGGVFLKRKKMFGFCGVEYKIQPLQIFLDETFLPVVTGIPNLVLRAAKR